MRADAAFDQRVDSSRFPVDIAKTGNEFIKRRLGLRSQVLRQQLGVRHEVGIENCRRIGQLVEIGHPLLVEIDDRLQRWSLGHFNATSGKTWPDERYQTVVIRQPQRRIENQLRQRAFEQRHAAGNMAGGMVDMQRLPLAKRRVALEFDNDPFRGFRRP